MTMKPLKRRQILVGSAALGAAATLPLRISAQTMPELQTLRSTAKSWLWAAEDYATARGFFTKAGVKVTSNASNRGTNIAALAGSGVDVVLGDPGEASRARNQNLAIRSFISTVNKYASNVVVTNAALKKAGVTEASPEAAKAAALKGLRLGTTGPGAAPDALFRWLSVQAKLDPNTDLRLVPIQGGGPGMLAGLQQGVIDGFCLSSPTSDLAVKDRDCGYLFNMALNPPAALKQYNYIIATTSEAALADKTRRESLVRYAMAIAMSLKDINTNPAAFKDWASKWFAGMPGDIFDRSFEINSKIFFSDPLPKRDLFDLNVSFLNTVQKTMNAAPLPASLTFASLYDPSVAQDALKRV